MEKPINSLGTWRLIAAIANERALLIEQTHTRGNENLRQTEDADLRLNCVANKSIKKLLEYLEESPN